MRQLLRSLPALKIIVLLMVAAHGVSAAASPKATAVASKEPVSSTPEVLVFSGVDDGIEWMKANDWWGDDWHERQLNAPRLLITGISDAWSENAQKLTVPVKKELFYRVMLPLVLHANEMVLDRRSKLHDARSTVAGGNSLTAQEQADLDRAAVQFRVLKEEDLDGLAGDRERILAVIDELLYRLDVVPAGLALGQAAYESGYGTSRFARQGNALFGQWTYGGEGLVPEQQREQLGDHRIAAYEWPFDSVRSYFINLMAHPAYEPFRRLRAERRAAGQPLSSLDLANGLLSYSERGQDYVDELKGIIRVNKLEAADQAQLRDEPLRLSVATQGEADAADMRDEIARMKASGELDAMVERMRLE